MWEKDITHTPFLPTHPPPKHNSSQTALFFPRSMLEAAAWFLDMRICGGQGREGVAGDGQERRFPRTTHLFLQFLQVPPLGLQHGLQLSDPLKHTPGQDGSDATPSGSNPDPSCLPRSSAGTLGGPPTSHHLSQRRAFPTTRRRSQPPPHHHPNSVLLSLTGS